MSGMDATKNMARIRQTLKYAAGGENAAESQVGGAMRELTGQRVAIGILVALLLTATFTYVEEDATRPATMMILHAQTTGTTTSLDDLGREGNVRSICGDIACGCQAIAVGDRVCVVLRHGGTGEGRALV